MACSVDDDGDDDDDDVGDGVVEQQFIKHTFRVTKLPFCIYVKWHKAVEESQSSQGLVHVHVLFWFSSICNGGSVQQV